MEWHVFAIACLARAMRIALTSYSTFSLKFKRKTKSHPCRLAVKQLKVTYGYEMWIHEGPQ